MQTGSALTNSSCSPVFVCSILIRVGWLGRGICLVFRFHSHSNEIEWTLNLTKTNEGITFINYDIFFGIILHNFKSFF